MESAITISKEIMQYLPLLPISMVLLFTFLLPFIFGGSVFSVEAMSGLPDAKFGAVFFAIAVFDFLLVVFVARKAFRSDGQGKAQFAPAVYAMCELPAVLGFALAYLDKTPAFFAPFALLTIIYSMYVFSMSRARA